MSADAKTVDLLMHVPLRVTAEIGACTLTMREVLALGSGSVVALDRAAGAPVDLMVNGTLVARGDLVAVDDRYGVRITAVVDAP